MRDALSHHLKMDMASKSMKLNLAKLEMSPYCSETKNRKGFLCHVRFIDCPAITIIDLYCRYFDTPWSLPLAVVNICTASCRKYPRFWRFHPHPIFLLLYISANIATPPPKARCTFSLRVRTASNPALVSSVCWCDQTRPAKQKNIQHHPFCGVVVSIESVKLLASLFRVSQIQLPAPTDF